MIYQTEEKFQNWRALAIYEDGGQGLLCVGHSTTQVRTRFENSFAELLDDEERARVRGISLQCWLGAADKGNWVHKGYLAIPGEKRIPVGASADPAPALLPFRRVPAA